MNEHLAFAQCLQRVLNETELTATEVARRLEMRSRNSIFRILKGKTSPQLNRRFLESFHKHMGEQLTEAQWAAQRCSRAMVAVSASPRAPKYRAACARSISSGFSTGRVLLCPSCICGSSLLF